jgi:hypothetical protein
VDHEAPGHEASKAGEEDISATEAHPLKTAGSKEVMTCAVKCLALSQRQPRVLQASEKRHTATVFRGERRALILSTNCPRNPKSTIAEGITQHAFGLTALFVGNYHMTQDVVWLAVIGSGFYYS